MIPQITRLNFGDIVYYNGHTYIIVERSGMPTFMKCTSTGYIETHTVKLIDTINEMRTIANA